MNKKEDFRFKRTEKMIKGAFIELLLEKNYNLITIKEIAHIAMINRNTFYLHYKNKDELRDKLAKACIGELKDSVYKLRLNEDVYNPNYRLETDAVFRHIEQNLLIYRAFLLKGNCSSFNMLLETFLSEAITYEVQRQRVFDYKKFPSLNTYSEFSAAGYIKVIVLWLDNKISLSDAKKTINQIITDNLHIE